MLKIIIKNSIVIIVISFISTRAIAQQEAQFSHYFINPITVNPALTGTENHIPIRAGFRSQWVGLESAPVTTYLSGHTTIGKKYGSAHNHRKNEHTAWHGLGGLIYYDNTGPIQRTSLSMSYAYNVAITKKIRASLGTYLGLKGFKYDPSGLEIADQQDTYASQISSSLYPDASLGLWVYSENFFCGVSSMQLFNQKLGPEEAFQNISEGRLNRHYFITGGVRMPLNKDVTLVPSFMAKMVESAPISIDLNAKLSYQDKFYTGLSFRNLNALTIMVGTLINYQIEMYYSYDFTTSDLNKVSYGSHEITVGYRFFHAKNLDCPDSFW